MQGEAFCPYTAPAGIPIFPHALWNLLLDFLVGDARSEDLINNAAGLCCPPGRRYFPVT